MNVLSLFDGISCGQIALERAGVKVEKYFASEIDVHAMRVANKNYPNTIQLGDIQTIDLHSLPKIDLLIGGSPCQGFSFAGKQLNFEDPRSKLFFDYLRTYKFLKEKNPDIKFLLENVKMKKEYQAVISNFLESDPILINSSYVSKQNRQRLYWTNIVVEQIEPRSDLDLNKFLYRLGHGYIKDEIKIFKKYPTLTAQAPATKHRLVVNIKEAKKALQENDLKIIRHGSNVTRTITPEECEEFQTLPIGYTDNLKKTQRFKCIGNGWTVDVIAHIFKGLKNMP